MDGDEAWFTAATNPGTSDVQRFSQVEFFVDAEEYFADLRKEVEATASGGLICWVGFDAGGYDGKNSVVNVPMPGAPPTGGLKPFARRTSLPTDKNWFDILAEATTTRNVMLRALLNLHPAPSPKDRYKPGNFDLVAKLNTLPHTLAINDFRYLWLNGTHHQKLVIVQNGNGLNAYVGTADVHVQRITDRWCEVHTKWRGDMALELYRVFYARYSEHTGVFETAGSDLSYLRTPEQVKKASGGGKVLGQVATTYGNPNRKSPLSPWVGPRFQNVNIPHRVVIRSTSLGVAPLLLSNPPGPVVVANDFFNEAESGSGALIAAARMQTATYGFAPNGATGIYRMLRDAIVHTKRFIYLEDQYLVCDQPMGNLVSMLDLLAAKVRDDRFQKLIIFCTRLDEINDEFQGTAGPHRRKCIEDLVAAGGDKVVVCQYKSNAQLSNGITPSNRSPFYIHSKTWIFDDEYLVVGSANFNRRGYSHDSEMDVGVYDVEKTAIHDLRSRIWLRRLNTEGVKTPLSRADVADPLAAAKFWEKPQEYGLTIENHRIGIDTFVPNSRSPQIVYDNASYGIAGGYGPAVDLVELAGASKNQLLWDVAVDPEGT